MTVVPERIILPRMMHTARSMTAVAGAGLQELKVYLLVIDFKDAFKQFLIFIDEQRFMAGQARIDGIDGFFVSMHCFSVQCPTHYNGGA